MKPYVRFNKIAGVLATIFIITSVVLGFPLWTVIVAVIIDLGCFLKLWLEHLDAKG